jgi:hypothetical protein
MSKLSPEEYEEVHVTVRDLARCIFAALLYARGDDEERPQRVSFAGGVFPANVTIDHTIPREDEFANYVDWIRKLHSKYIDTMPHPDFNPIAPVSEFGVHTAPTMHSAVINAAGYLLGFRNKTLPQLRKLCATLPLPTLDVAMIHLWNEYRLTCPTVDEPGSEHEEPPGGVTGEVDPLKEFRNKTVPRARKLFDVLLEHPGLHTHSIVEQWYVGGNNKHFQKGSFTDLVRELGEALERFGRQSGYRLSRSRGSKYQDAKVELVRPSVAED